MESLPQPHSALSTAPLGFRQWLYAQRQHDPDATLINSLLYGAGSKAQSPAGIRRDLRRYRVDRLIAVFEQLFVKWQAELATVCQPAICRRSAQIIDLVAWRNARQRR